MKRINYTLFIVIALFLISCGEGNLNGKDAKKGTKAVWDITEDPGIGPIDKVVLKELDPALAEKGKEVFKTYCSACHKIKKKYIGPAVIGITKNRTPEWIMNMIMNPDGMMANNENAKKHFAEYAAPMANQNMTKDQARSILEYFRLRDSEKK
ncbi:MAG: cytochrome c [Lentimicrobiaceae bacterium]|jgi:cytochrome c1|nr:cytochrome c [Lentimicrobiaceae bacterium]MBT3454413.1 cytochrome c [Lentimicrobiaceae bacterium]MBT3818726.1 cytochrome c [Lentimicrobiaceae bacterium]MBT4062348.1 cytochrome c [Lentimicrobiaceae bacterium]MBT4190875.1 cytochrome c [Lentimicrobiaceae bacterium]